VAPKTKARPPCPASVDGAPGKSKVVGTNDRPCGKGKATAGAKSQATAKATAASKGKDGGKGHGVVFMTPLLAAGLAGLVRRLRARPQRR
jgi:hypothetical protein